MDGEPIPTMATATCGAEYMALGLFSSQRTNLVIYVVEDDEYQC